MNQTSLFVHSHLGLQLAARHNDDTALSAAPQDCTPQWVGQCQLEHRVGCVGACEEEDQGAQGEAHADTGRELSLQADLL
jgi:hypothetical protein